MASSEYSPQKRPASTEQAASQPLKGYSDDEARDIYARAAEIQSQTAFDDDKLTPEMLERSANRAGISDAAVQQAIKERERDRVAAIAKEKARAAQKARLQKQLLVGAVGLSLITGGTMMMANNALGARVQAIKSAQSQVGNVQERRHNLLPNLINVTKATLKNEQALIEQLNLATQATQRAGSPEAKLSAETQLSGVVSRTLSKLGENNSSSSEAVKSLTFEMAGAENRITQEKRKYNQAVEAYNNTAGSFPLGFAGRLMGHRPRYDYLPTSEAAKQPVKF